MVSHWILSCFIQTSQETKLIWVGIDLDWEYPGAPDRGGKPEDTKNYVSLVQTLRSVFNASPRPLGITFTAPSSYWYLKWFDLPGMDKYVDWINVMTVCKRYDEFVGIVS